MFSGKKTCFGWLRHPKPVQLNENRERLRRPPKPVQLSENRGTAVIPKPVQLSESSIK